MLNTGSQPTMRPEADGGASGPFLNHLDLIHSAGAVAHRRRRSSCQAVASPDPMSRIAARTPIGVVWPQPAENQTESACGR